MALRLLPFRQYDEQDVVNIFALKNADVLESTTGDGAGSNGVFVTVSDGNFDQDVITYGSNSYLGKTDYPFVGADMDQGDFCRTCPVAIQWPGQEKIYHLKHRTNHIRGPNRENYKKIKKNMFLLFFPRFFFVFLGFF